MSDRQPPVSARQLSDTRLLAYLDESLPIDQLTAIELALRQDVALQNRVRQLIQRESDGVHSLAAIWRRHRIACPSRETLGSFLLGGLDVKEVGYVEFHLNIVDCMFCRSSIEDLHQSSL